jgi:hypothetical protein
VVRARATAERDGDVVAPKQPFPPQKKARSHRTQKQFFISIKSSNFSCSISATHCKGGDRMGRDVWQKVKNPLLIIAGAAFLVWFALFSPCH